MLDLRLAYRITDRRKNFRNIETIPKLIIDDVANFYALHEKQNWDLFKDIPNFAPPFNSFFVEWISPKAWRNDGVITPSIDPNMASQFGFFVESVDLEKEGFKTVDDCFTWMSATMKFSIDEDQGDSGDDIRKLISDSLPRAKWLINCSSWISSNLKPICGEAIYFGIEHFLFVDKTGRLIDQMVSGPDIVDRTSDNRFVRLINNNLKILGLGISFTHCKNIETVEHTHDRGEKWHRRSKIPKLKFHTLDIQPMKKVLRTEGQSESTGIKKALHICRGHFATYSPDHPLFGKYTGTFWRPDHTRGQIEQGQVTKDYRIKT